MELVICSRGQLHCLYSEALDLGSLVTSLGPATIRRASFVEPAATGDWQVDLGPVEGPVIAGFATRSQALAFEQDWLARYWLPQACAAAAVS